MAEEITVVTKLSVLKGSIAGSQSVAIKATQTTAGVVSKSQTIPTSDTVISLAGLTAPRWASIKNVDPTNYIEIGPTVAGAIAPLFRLKAGEPFEGPLVPGVVLRAQANTAAVAIEILLLET